MNAQGNSEGRKRHPVSQFPAVWCLLLPALRGVGDRGASLGQELSPEGKWAGICGTGVPKVLSSSNPLPVNVSRKNPLLSTIFFWMAILAGFGFLGAVEKEVLITIVVMATETSQRFPSY